MNFVNRTNKELKLAIFNQTDRVRTIPLQTINIRAGRRASWTQGGNHRFAVVVFIPGIFDEHVSTHERLKKGDTLTLTNGSSNGVFGHVAHTSVQAAEEVGTAVIQISRNVARTANQVGRELERSGQAVEQAILAADAGARQAWADTERFGQQLLRQVDFVGGLRAATNHLERQAQLFAAFQRVSNDIFAPGRFERELETLITSIRSQRFDPNVATFMRRLAAEASVENARRLAAREGMGGTFYFGICIDGAKTLSSIPVGVRGGLSLGYTLIYDANGPEEVIFTADISAGPLLGTDGFSFGLEFGFGSKDLVKFDHTVAIGLGATLPGVSLGFTVVQGLPFSFNATQPRITRFGSGSGIVVSVAPAGGIEKPEFEASLSYGIVFELGRASLRHNQFAPQQPRQRTQPSAGAQTAPRVDPNRFYKLQNVVSQQAIANNGSTAFGAALVQRSTIRQGGHWQFEPANNGFFRLRNRQSGMYIANFGSRDHGAALKQTNNPGAGALWRLVPGANGSVQLQNAHSQLFMANLQRREEQAPIVQVTNPGAGSLWRLVAV